MSTRLPIQHGERIMLYDIAPLDWIILFFSITRQRGIVVPVDTRVHPSFIEDACRLTTPILVITDSKEKVPTGPHAIKSVEDIRGTAQAIETREQALTNPDDPLEIIFTSGTWAAPKGVTLTHKNIVSNVKQLASLYSFADQGASLLILPLSHAYAQMIGLFNPLFEGREVVVLSQITSLALPEAVKKYSVVSIPAVPKVLTLLYNAILKNVESPAKRWLFLCMVRWALFLPRRIRALLFHHVHAALGKSLRIFMVGGAPLSKKIDDFFRGLGFEVLIGYGLTECSPVLTIGLDGNRREGAVGQLLSGIESYLDEHNELWVKGDNIFMGYWPDIHRQGYFGTGDIFHKSPNGELLLYGRSKNLIVFPNGDKVFSEDIEGLFRKLSGADEVCVLNIGTPAAAHIVCAVPEDEPLAHAPEILKEKINAHLPTGIMVAEVLLLDKHSYVHTHTLKANRQKILAAILELKKREADAHAAG